MSETDELWAALDRLKTEDGQAAFIAQRSSLDYERVLRLYKLGQPWPLTGDLGMDFERQAVEAGADLDTYVTAILPLLEMNDLVKSAKMQDFEEKAQRFTEKVARGDEITPEDIAAFEEEIAAWKAEFASPILDQHIDTVANLSGEPREIIVTVLRGVHDVEMCLHEVRRALDQSTSG